jgi:hypothetical protein
MTRTLEVPLAPPGPPPALVLRWLAVARYGPPHGNRLDAPGRNSVICPGERRSKRLMPSLRNPTFAMRVLKIRQRHRFP